jgi:hypothetical protein
MPKAKSGGGITSNKLVNKGLRTGGPAKAVNSAYPGQLGAHFGDHADRGDTPKTPAVKMDAGAALPSRMGNAVAASTPPGPGGGRTNYGKSGMQGVHGPVNPGQSPAPRDILSDFGPEMNRRK